MAYPLTRKNEGRKRTNNIRCWDQASAHSRSKLPVSRTVTRTRFTNFASHSFHIFEVLWSDFSGNPRPPPQPKVAISTEKCHSNDKVATSGLLGKLLLTAGWLQVWNTPMPVVPALDKWHLPAEVTDTQNPLAQFRTSFHSSASQFVSILLTTPFEINSAHKSNLLQTNLELNWHHHHHYDLWNLTCEPNEHLNICINTCIPKFDSAGLYTEPNQVRFRLISIPGCNAFSVQSSCFVVVVVEFRFAIW